ncbi:MAG: cysteine--tRNA ligase [Candidatus Yanofskybacteria bacterium CG10_big_fil_rev_8_21_14_0_10_37_15]|uniref:Cysteine--tRNA ligase n=1 Tax=Candidatus Yanofskybacteria bacterium CG10_big_fil_rev_8_21_14_0_10_37_15 TaxID=1975097 RepID=A0A2H0R610_9BACT|nr:MAG: cysteine--tRNA ligase [Candidatus Yanofskybacteria bacterium CG10_big_fil_rev_8_21_14_0_10_37_15]
MIKILDTLSGQKKELVLDKNNRLNMFVCGPTVYDYIHIGNARTFVFFDVVAKYLKHKGWKVDYIQNITDIDDKIINKSRSENKKWKEIADSYFEEFKKDAMALGIDSPRYLRATNYIDEVKNQVKKLKKKGHVYLVENDGWYFDLKTFPEYGKLSKRTVEMSDDAISRIDESAKKRNMGDFVVWKLSDPSETEYWHDKELGHGRPGWHIEDTAITEKEFGPQYDLHGGGQDLIFPHHEAEITQQESASGKKPFVKYWMHVGFLINKDQKMSKSLGNFQTANELIKKHSKEVLRFFLLSGHYRTPIDFNDKVLKQSEAGINRIYEFIQKLNLAVGKGKDEAEDLLIAEIQKKFFEALDDDFNTSQAIASIFELIRRINARVTNNSLTRTGVKDIKKFLKKADEILGIIPSKRDEPSIEVKALIKDREKLREAGNFIDADKKRAQIEEMGYKIEDTVYGPLITRRT